MMKFTERAQKYIVPQWKNCQYNETMIKAYLETIERMSSLFRGSWAQSTSYNVYSQGNEQRMLNITSKIQKTIRKIMRRFLKVRDKELEVIQKFSKLKVLELGIKFDYYKQALFYTPQNDQDSLILLQNLYIEGILLQSLIKHALQADERININILKITSLLQQLQAPQTDREKVVRRFYNSIQTLKSRIQLAYLKKKNPEFKRKDKKMFREQALAQTQQNIFGFGFNISCGLILFLFSSLVYVIYNNSINLADHQVFQVHFPIWRGIGSVLLFIWTLGIVSLIFDTYQINYKKILILQRHKVPAPSAILMLASPCSIFYLVMFNIYIFKIGFGESNIVPGLELNNFPGLTCVVIMMVIFFPVNFDKFNNFFSRRYFVQQILVRMLFSWVIGVQFATNWLSENLSSWKQPFQDLVYSYYYYAGNYTKVENQNISLYIGAWIGTSIFLLRILQGLKSCSMQRSETSFWKFYCKKSPFGRGAIKCLLNIGTIWVSYQYRIREREESSSRVLWMAGWLIIGLISSLYAFTFDVFFDWNLLTYRSNGCSCLKSFRVRQSRVFAGPTYFSGAVLNFFLRVSWTLTLSTDVVTILFGKHKYLAVLIFTYLQFVRRGIWNVFMIEKEHVKNISRFDAIVNCAPIQKRINQRFEAANPVQKKKAYSKYRFVMHLQQYHSKLLEKHVKKTEENADQAESRIKSYFTNLYLKNGEKLRLRKDSDSSDSQ